MYKYKVFTYTYYIWTLLLNLNIQVKLSIMDLYKHVAGLHASLGLHPNMVHTPKHLTCIRDILLICFYT